jgi:hypothetical protein
MTQDPGHGEQRPPGPPAYPPPPPGWGPPPGYPVPPPPRKTWGAARIVLVTLAGLLLVVGLLVAAVAVLGPLVEEAPQDAERDGDGRIVARATVSKNALRTGDCVNDAALRDLELGGDLQTQSGSVEVVPCDQRHDFEVTAAFTVPEGDYSEAEALRKAVHQGCVRRLREEWAADRKLLRDKILAYYLPAAWATQEDNAVCMLQLASAEQMRGPIR